GEGLDPGILEHLKTARIVEVPGYTTHADAETARDRATRREAVEQAVATDLLILLIDGRSGSSAPDIAFAQAWSQWFVDHPRLDVPPALAVLPKVDSPEFGGDWKPPYNWLKGEGSRETAVRARLAALRAALPPTIAEVAAVGLGEQSPFGIVES